jgi:hypothetical protein
LSVGFQSFNNKHCEFPRRKREYRIPHICPQPLPLLLPFSLQLEALVGEVEEVMNQSLVQQGSMGNSSAL